MDIVDDVLEVEVAAAIEQIEARRARRRERLFRDRQNPLEFYSDHELFSRYRFDRQSIIWLTMLLQDNLRRHIARSNSFPAIFLVLIALSFYATGTFLMCVGDQVLFQVHNSSVSRVLTSGTEAIVRRMPNLIRFPNVNERRQIMQDFFQVRRFPGVVALWPGSVHDSWILRESTIGRRFDTGLERGILLGDSGYPCRPWLMTPFLNPHGEAQDNYNRAHMETRSIVERGFGQLKKRFSCLHVGMWLQPKKVCKIICACATLHNISKERGLPEWDDILEDDQPPVDINHVPDCAAGRVARDRIVDNYFT